MRDFKGYSQDYVAAQLNMSPRQYQRLESGGYDIALRRLEELCRILEVKPSELLSLDEKYVMENTPNRRSEQEFAINNLPELLLRQYQEQIVQLKEEVAFLRKRLEQR